MTYTLCVSPGFLAFAREKALLRAEGHDVEVLTPDDMERHPDRVRMAGLMAQIQTSGRTNYPFVFLNDMLITPNTPGTKGEPHAAAPVMRPG